MAIHKYLDPKNDFAFKRIFGSEKNKDILIALLNSVLKNQLNCPIKEVTFLNPTQDPEVAAKKQSIVDILCQDVYGKKYVVEMQVASAGGFESRAQYYAFKTFVSQAGEGQEYEDLKAVIFLAFTNFSVFPKKEKYKTEHVILDRDTQERDLDKISFTFVDLVKFDAQLKSKNKGVEDLTQEEKFYYFLCHAPETKPDDLRKIVKNSAVIKKAYDELDRYYLTPEELSTYERDEKRLKDYYSSIEEAKRQGSEKTIQKLVDAGFDREDIEKALEENT